MFEKEIKYTENLKSSKIQEKIKELSYNFLKEYTRKKETIKKITNFETSKGLDSFKKEIQKLQNSGELDKKINIEKLFYDLKKLKEQIQLISQKERQKLKNQLKENKSFSPNSKYDVGEIIKQKNPSLYKKIINPQGLKQNIISAGFGIGNSIYKIGVGLGKITIDFLKLITFKTNLKEFKELYKKV